MTPFAIGFMGVSMLAVTCLAGWCMYRILTGGSSGGETQHDEDSH